MSRGHRLPCILYRDDALIVLEKPSGMPSAGENSLEEWLQKRCFQARLVHRLDNDTSGLMVAARTEEIFQRMRVIWKSKEVTKEYTALVLGHTPPKGVIARPIGHHPRKKKKMVVGNPKGRRAITYFKTIRYIRGYSLLKVKIQTGVRHQIRAHLASLGHPVAGDRLYQNVKKRKENRLELQRHFLHLGHLKFKHPETGQSLVFEADLPLDLKIILK